MDIKGFITAYNEQCFTKRQLHSFAVFCASHDDKSIDEVYEGWIKLQTFPDTPTTSEKEVNCETCYWYKSTNRASAACHGKSKHIQPTTNKERKQDGK